MHLIPPGEMTQEIIASFLESVISSLRHDQTSDIVSHALSKKRRNDAARSNRRATVVTLCSNASARYPGYRSIFVTLTSAGSLVGGDEISNHLVDLHSETVG